MMQADQNEYEFSLTSAREELHYLEVKLYEMHSRLDNFIDRLVSRVGDYASFILESSAEQGIDYYVAKLNFERKIALKKTYRKLVKMVHPDANQSLSDSAEFMQISEAYRQENISFLVNRLKHHERVIVDDQINENQKLKEFRKIHNRIKHFKNKIDNLKKSETYALYEKSEYFRMKGISLIDEIQKEFDSRYGKASFQ